MRTPISNGPNLQRALDYLWQLMQARLDANINDGALSTEALQLADDGSFISAFFNHNRPSLDETALILLALQAHIMPSFFDKLFEDLHDDISVLDFGGCRDNPQQRFYPTGETALYLLAAHDQERRLDVIKLFSSHSWLAKVLSVATTESSYFDGRILLQDDYVQLFTKGHIDSPIFGKSFPAQRLETDLTWDDLVLTDKVKSNIADIRLWVEKNHVLRNDWGMAAKFKPGYAALFHGPPGTGKTLTASLIGKFTGRVVYRVDLSMVVSKYIGETTQNLASLFDKAEAQDWILFFDEADALFGKRTGVKDAHDRFANQEVSYLLQRIEQYDGLVVMASNLKANIDEAFIRRFNCVLGFSLPSVNERRQIWELNLPGNASISGGKQAISELARYELSGAAIVNAMQYGCLKAIQRNETALQIADLIEGIKQEVEKQGAIFKRLE